MCSSNQNLQIPTKEIFIMENTKKQTLIQLFLAMLYISAFTFGGGFVIVTFMKKKFSDELHWLEENEMLDKQIELIDAKVQNLQSSKRTEELYADALNAMKKYSGQDDDNEDY